MTKITERPMIFNGEMVSAILDAGKTQTRRPVKFPHIDRDAMCELSGNELAGELLAGNYRNSPHGKPGDRIWVRETWWQAGQSYARYPDDDEYGWYGSRRVLFAADGNPPNEPNDHYPNGLGGGKFSAAKPNHLWRKRPSIHMPRWASRILLEITDVRVERLQAITLGDICKEIGCGLYDFRPATYGFQVWEELWESIYGEGSWQANPWVWVIEFKRIEGDDHATD
ncbi:hypothetical protein [Citrobacter meridianamericanus]|uniref:hypothetical protein n=1 Tax=Citrobacter TaxID=544 RepID=UPI00351D9033